MKFLVFLLMVMSVTSSTQAAYPEGRKIKIEFSVTDTPFVVEQDHGGYCALKFLFGVGTSPDIQGPLPVLRGGSEYFSSECIANGDYEKNLEFIDALNAGVAVGGSKLAVDADYYWKQVSGGDGRLYMVEIIRFWMPGHEDAFIFYGSFQQSKDSPRAYGEFPEREEILVSKQTKLEIKLKDQNTIEVDRDHGGYCYINIDFKEIKSADSSDSLPALNHAGAYPFMAGCRRVSSEDVEKIIEALKKKIERRSDGDWLVVDAHYELQSREDVIGGSFTLIERIEFTLPESQDPFEFVNNFTIKK